MLHLPVKTRRNSFSWGRGHHPPLQNQRRQSIESWRQTLNWTDSDTSRDVIPKLETLLSCLWLSQTGSETRGNTGWEGVWLCAEYTDTLWLYRNWITGLDTLIRSLNTWCPLPRSSSWIQSYDNQPEPPFQNLSLSLHHHYWFAIGWSECNWPNLKDILSINKCEKCDLGNVITVDATLLPNLSV